MKNLSPQILEQIREAIKRPKGTMSFEYVTENDLFDPIVPGGIIFHTPSGEHYFRLERTNNAEVQFYHFSPGTGTRVASIDLKHLTPSEKVFIVFSWSPKEIQLHIRPRVEGGELVSAIGVQSKVGFRVGKDGSIVQVGGPGVEVIGTRVNVGGKQIIKPTAIDAWNETKKAIEILLTGESKEGFIFETVRANLSIVMMVTGFEAYSKTRYQEIEGEGISPDNELVKEKLEKRKENFQDFDGYCKDIFKFGYGIKFSGLVSSNEFDRLKQLFTFRSRIVHASPMISMVNEFEVPKEEPIFSTNIVNDALILFNYFINRLHEETLKLRRKD
ncbi:MAG: hypothetical protein Q8P66_02745 [Candidatus Colwellbacteria bacterium]|nr:hypothetical protein [Candidatus Colwellbacteria bacterium]